MHPLQDGIEDGVILGMEPRKADTGIGLVHRAIGLDPRIILVHLFAGAQTGSAAITGARVDPVERNHQL